jgi:hypothetical protein
MMFCILLEYFLMHVVKGVGSISSPNLICTESAFSVQGNPYRKRGDIYDGYSGS